MPIATLKIEHGGASLTGKRAQNQDAILVKVPDNNQELTHKGIVACIADGVSCSDQSQRASHTAVVQFVNDYFATPSSWSIKHSASKILTAINSWLYEEGSKQALTHNSLVTTFSCVIIKSNTAHIFHVGDTRIYLMRDGELELLTKDHQRVNLAKQAYLTRALGMDSNLDVDYQQLSLKKGDRFILTTDGVHDTLDVSSQVSSASLTSQQLSDQLCQSALEKGSEDNLSALVLDILELPAQSLPEHQLSVLSRSIPPALDEGHKLDHFKVLKILHAGARSHVYQVLDETSGEIRVLKTPSEQYRDELEFLKGFANEQWVGTQLKNKRVMKVYPTPVESKFVYQICEHIEGMTLRQWMYDNPKPSLQQARSILDETVKALRVFQRADMVHRDLKPENIMITPSGEVKIIDFGAVKVKGLEEISPESQDTVPLGAVNYIAPEYLNTGKANLVSDLFSVAVIGYEMLTGELPYKPSTSQNLNAARHTKWVYRSLSDYRDDIPTWVDLVFRKATHHLPNRRYQVLGDFIADLYIPNPVLQKEKDESPLIKRNPVLFWKILALMATGVALVETLMLVSK
ncbi:bifunctional protein-serine/threonine kinase/phosphatase [Vibrio ishigakensis]|uniref:bifunctional protein-serine/threonine kinase/phosphatase n=1 Tax=Vibrio ishigakensis TaxID=1481914 RepID=UPI0021C48594|nr:bifunctional protein-serine/threonine kinase/phosphatase [Vibrio ishigakensis]